MSRKEVPRAGLLKAALAGQITNAQAAGALRLSVRQVQRLKRQFQREGVAGLRHHLRGRPSPRRLPAQVREQVATLLRTTYAGLNDCHATEKLRELEGLLVSRASVRRIRQALGLPAKHRRRPRQYRARRTPAPRMGQLVQVDGSPFDWLEGRGPAMTLHGAIDDATGTGLALHFRPTEDLHGYATVLHALCAQYGLPVTLYGDRLAILVRNDPYWTLAEELQGHQEPTHFGTMLRELAIGFIAAGSPQAKGRIERLWRTLQDRLVVELRLQGIRTREAANAALPAFLADFNRRFASPPAEASPAWRRPPLTLPDLLSCRYTRTVAPDNTVRLGSRWVQLPPGPHRRSYAGRRVQLHECVDGRLLVFCDGQRLTVQPSPDPAFVLRPRSKPHSERTRLRDAQPRPLAPARSAARASSRPTPPIPRHSAAARPPLTHPWRRPFSRRGRTNRPSLPRG